MPHSLIRNIIIAPHGDDELIGCYEVISNSIGLVGVHFVEYSPESVFSNCARVLDYMEFITEPARNCPVNFFFPDPIHELHPLHRKMGQEGEALARKGYRVFFYTTNMNAPYMREVKDPMGKKEALDATYPLKKTLWEYDHKYWLFEGTCRWAYDIWKEVN